MTEEELCRLFSDQVRAAGWLVYPETAGWDLVLLGPDGCQVGVEAKRRPNLHVLVQAMGGENVLNGSGPDYRAVLVPKASRDFVEVAQRLRLWVFEGRDPGLRVASQLATLNYFSEWVRKRYWWRHPSCLWLPKVPINTPAGVPAPRQVSRWKIAAVELSILLNKRGFLTQLDFADRGIHLTSYWRLRLRNEGTVEVKRDGKLLKRAGYRRDPNSKFEMPDQHWPEIAKAVRSKKWKSA